MTVSYCLHKNTLDDKLLQDFIVINCQIIKFTEPFQSDMFVSHPDISPYPLHS
jgi:hypothetical protein